MTARRGDRLPVWPALLATAAGVALLALGHALAEFVDDAIAGVDYS